MSNNGGGGPNDPWAWLGLLKWSLSYSDGTSDTSQVCPLSAEDRAFLEQVMKDGIVDENERMKTILKEVSDQMEKWRDSPNVVLKDKKEEEAHVLELLEELRDIVEQVDFARNFCSMTGLSFLLGCVGEREAIPRSVRLLCLGIVATLCHNNPPVQQELLEKGSIRVLSDLYFVEERAGDDADGQMRARILQAISANVRSHDLAESVFCQLEQAVTLIERGLGISYYDDQGVTTHPVMLRQRALFFLRALLTSDTADQLRIGRFASCITFVMDHLLYDSDRQLREMALEMVEEMLRQNKDVNTLLRQRDIAVAAGMRRIAVIRALEGEERDLASVELELWESVLALLARAELDTSSRSVILGQ